MVLGFFHRAFTICSSWLLFHKEVQNILRILKCNNYPKVFIDKCLHKFLTKKFSSVSQDSNSTETDFCNIIGIPFVGFDSIIFKKKLQRIFNSINCNIFIYFNCYKVSHYFSLKDSTSILLKSGVVYKFKCQVDPGITYIGKTKRHLCKRISEHSKPNSPIHSHISICNPCKNSLNSCFEIIDSAPKDFNLRIKESFYIRQYKPSLNNQLHNAGSFFTLKVF